MQRFLHLMRDGSWQGIGVIVAVVALLVSVAVTGLDWTVFADRESPSPSPSGAATMTAAPTATPTVSATPPATQKRILGDPLPPQDLFADENCGPWRVVPGEVRYRGCLIREGSGFVAGGQLQEVDPPGERNVYAQGVLTDSGGSVIRFVGNLWATTTAEEAGIRTFAFEPVSPAGPACLAFDIRLVHESVDQISESASLPVGPADCR